MAKKILLTFFGVVLIFLVLGFMLNKKIVKNNDEILKASLKKFQTLKSEKMSFYRTSVFPDYDNKGAFYHYASLDTNSIERVGFFTVYVDNMKNKELFLKDFTVSFSDSLRYHFIRKDGDIDTLYYYIINRVHGFRKFRIGKYNYYFEKNKLNKKEAKFYLEHIDSLKKVRGDVKIFGNKYR